MTHRAWFSGHDELAAGQLLGEPDLARVHTPGHGHHSASEPCCAEPEQGSDRGVTGTSCYGCEHVIS
jgi:hypothetical protein